MATENSLPKHGIGLHKVEFERKEKDKHSYGFITQNESSE